MVGGNTIELHNVALVPGYNSNLISFSQLRKSRIIYHNNPTTMTLMKDEKVIVEAKKERNLFTFDLAHLGKIMTIISLWSKASLSKSRQLTIAMTGYGQPIQLMSQNKFIQLWYQRLAHISNAIILRVTKLVDGIKLNIKEEYVPVEKLIGSNNSKVSKDEENVTNEETVVTTATRQITVTDEPHIIDNLCTPYLGSKSI